MIVHQKTNLGQPWLGLHGASLALFSWLPLSYYRMVGWPWIGLWQLGWLLGLGWGLGQLRQLKRPFYWLGHGLDGWVGATGLVLGVSSLLSPFPRVAVWNTSLVVSYGLGLYVYRHWVVRHRLARPWLWRSLVAVAAGSAVISLGLWRPAGAMWQSQNFWGALRNYQPLGHHNFVGGYLGLTLPLAVGLAIATSGSTRQLAWLATGVIALAIYASGSRGAALGLVVWLAVTWMTRLIREPQRRWRWAGVGLGGLALVGLTLATNPRIRAWFSPAAGGIVDGPTLDRWFMLRLGGNILRHRPWVGVGPGVMSRVSNLYRPIETGAGLDHIQQLHNTPLQLAGELGLPGLLLYGTAIALVGRLGWRLWQQPLEREDRALLGGLLGGLLTYAVSSLTDYQLENIPIAGTLLGLGVLLLSLADTYETPPKAMAATWRRGTHLGVWIWMGLLFYIWLPFTLTVGFGARADRAFDQQQLNLADSRWYKATRLSPWDPTAAAVASETLYGLDQILGDSEAKENVRSLLLDYAQQAQRAAPNDAWFNQNLAVLYQTDDPTQALPYAARAVQLLPRNANSGYWLLGELLEATGQTQAAIAAFTLEALVNPAALTAPLWQTAPLQTLYPEVVAATLAEYDQLLAEMAPTDQGFSTVYETRVVLGWWTGNPLAELNPDALRPLVQALLLADTDPAAALLRVETALATEPPTTELQLLAAWLDPSTHWATYAEAVGAPADLDFVLLEDSLAIQPLRLWLTALTQPPPRGYRAGMAFAYRNYQAQQITLMLHPEHLERYGVIHTLGLFQPWPREFPALDQRLEALRTEALGLPHPTHHHFQLVPLSLEPQP